jgi:hypothetical protein
MCDNNKGKAPEFNLPLHAECYGDQDQRLSTPTRAPLANLPRHASCGDEDPWSGQEVTPDSRPDVQLPLHAQCFPGGVPPNLKIPQQMRDELSSEPNGTRRRAQAKPSPVPDPPHPRAQRRADESSTSRAPIPRVGRVREREEDSGHGRHEREMPRRRRPQNFNKHHSEYGAHVVGFYYCNALGCEYSSPGDGFRHSGPHEIDQETLFKDTDEELAMTHPVPKIWLDQCSSNILRFMARAIQDVPTRGLVLQSEIDGQQFEASILTDREIREFDRNRRQTYHHIQSILERRQSPNQYQGRGRFPSLTPRFGPW